jgi:ribosomal protein L29
MVTKKAKQQSTEEMQKMLVEKRTALREFRFHIEGGRVKNVKQGRELRREIARLLTALSAMPATV